MLCRTQARPLLGFTAKNVHSYPSELSGSARKSLALDERLQVMQVLEGSRSEVSALYNSIVKDARHRDVELLLLEEISERRFASWTMGQVNLAKVNPSLLLRYSEKPELNPFALGGASSLALLEELIATAAIVGRSH